MGKAVSIQGRQEEGITGLAAEHLLAVTALSVEEIARTVGFDTAPGFATSFKKMTGLSPSDYRRQIAFHCLGDPSTTEDLNL